MPLAACFPGAERQTAPGKEQFRRAALTQDYRRR
jgi:hypothetical protein